MSLDSRLRRAADDLLASRLSRPSDGIARLVRDAVVLGARLQEERGQDDGARERGWVRDLSQITHR